MNTTFYYAPTYFSPFYFPPLSPLNGQGNSPAVVRDQDVFNAIVAALLSTQVFADVLFGPLLDQSMIAADRVPLAVVTPDRWAEYDDVDPTSILRQVGYKLTLLVRDEDPSRRYDALDALSSIAQNVLDGSNLNGGCLPALTKLRAGRYEAGCRSPEQRLVLEGEFSYLIPSYNLHVTD